MAFRNEAIEAQDHREAIAQAVKGYVEPAGMALASAILTDSVGNIVWSINPALNRNQSRFDTGGSSPLEG